MVMNHCKYLTVGQKNVCGNKCRGDYCAVHNARLKTYVNPPSPCIVCGAGTFRSVQICSDCTPGGRYSNKRYDEKIRKIASQRNEDYDTVRNKMINLILV